MRPARRARGARRRGRRRAGSSAAPAAPATSAHARSARVRADDAGRGDPCFTAVTRAPASSGKVTIEISQRSTATRLRTRVFGSMRARAARKPIDRQAVDGAGAQQRQQFSRPRHLGDEAAARIEAVAVLAKLEPDADGLGRVVLEQHRHAARTAHGERVAEGALEHHVACGVDFAEQTGIAFDGPVCGDARLRCEHVGDGGIAERSEHDARVPGAVRHHQRVYARL